MRSLALALLCWLVLLAPAGAQPSGPSEADLARAAELYQKAERLYEVREYEEAARLFKEAYLLSGEPALLLNMAQCYRFLERYDEALRTYEAYLRQDPESEYRGEVERLIGEMKEISARKQALGEELPPGPFRPSDPRPKAPREKGLSPAMIYGASAGTALLGLLFGAGGLSAAAEANDLFEGDPALGVPADIEASRASFRKARALGITCDILLVASVAGVGAGYLKQRQKKEAGN
jgi:tetratricopeptide (TPR) repeat protein